MSLDNRRLQKSSKKKIVQQQNVKAFLQTALKFKTVFKVAVNSISLRNLVREFQTDG